MRVGPFNGFLLDNFVEFLEERNIKYKIEQSPDAVERILESQRTKFPSKGIYRPTGDFIFFEIANSDVEKIKPELQRQGLWPEESAAPAELAPQYLCPQCDYASDKPGVCKLHHVSLLEFSEWEKLGQSSEAQNRKIMRFWFVAVVVITAALFALRHFKII